MSITKTIRRLFRRDPANTFDPSTYWEMRHQSHFGSRKAVGHRQLSDMANAEQYETKRRHIATMIARYVDDPRQKTLLDAGCGAGVLTPTYVGLGFDVVGVDFSETAIRSARCRGVQAQFFVSPLCELDIEQRFDVVTAIDVLLHIVDQQEWRATLGVLAKHLKPDGTLIILDRFTDDGASWSTHCHPRSLNDYTKALADLHLRIDAHEQFALEHEDSEKDLIAVLAESRVRRADLARTC